MTNFNKKFFKFAALFTVIVLSGWGIVKLVQYYQYRQSPEYQAEQYLKEMEQKYREDTYGGNTPEETLQLFIDALKKGDIELAAKYFVVDKQEEWKNDLEIAKQNNHLDLFIQEVQNTKNGKEIYEGNYLYTIPDKNNIAQFTISLVKNKLTNKWKIEEI